MNTNTYKEQLLEEKKTLEAQLGEVGTQNPKNPDDWQGVPDDTGKEQADSTDVADNMEEFETNTAIVAELETRLLNVNNALDRIEKGTFGACKSCGNQIEEDRLTANPAADTCKEHMND